MNDQELLRYSRHILLDDIDIAGQEKIRAARVFIIGAGGLGCPAALYLASAGVGHLTIVDDDTVDLTNLQRQILHTTARVGTPKVDSAKVALHAVNADVDVIALKKRVDEADLAVLLQNVDVVLDCCDNFETRHAVNRACVAAQVPLISGAAVKFDGQIGVFAPHLGAPCYGCLFSPEQQFEDVQCAMMGVFAPLVGIIGAMQAAEALKLIVGIGQPLLGKLGVLDAKTMKWQMIEIEPNPECPICGQKHK